MKNKVSSIGAINKFTFLFLSLIGSYFLIGSSILAPGSSSPIISSIKWGQTTIEYANGKTQVFKDVRLWPGNAQEWDWGKSGTQHNPGTQIADFQDFFDTIDVLVLSKGMDEVLQIHPETITFLKNSGKEYHIVQTEKAVEIYNKLAKAGKKVGALIHSTC